MQKTLRTFILVIIVFAAKSTHAQTAQEMDTKVAGYLTQLETLANDTVDHSDAIGDINDKLSAYMKQILVKPASMSAPFTKSKSAGLDAYVSSDNKVRFYSWDTWTGGTMHFFQDIVQYRAAKGIKIIFLNDINLARYDAANGIKGLSLNNINSEGGCSYSGILTIHTNKNQLVYLISCAFVKSSTIYGESIRAYTIKDDRVVTINFFQSSKADYDISFLYFRAVDGDFNKKKHSIHFSEDKSKLYIPRIKIDNSFTQKYSVYVFNGDKFVYNKSEQ